MTGDDTTLSDVQKLILSQVLIAIVLLVSWLAFKALDAQKPVVEKREIETASLNVDVFTAERIDVQELLTGFGTARADQEVILAAQVTGEIVEVNPQLEVGYSVAAEQSVVSPDHPSRTRAADTLLKIDPRVYQQRYDQASHRIAETKTDIEQLKVQQTNNSRQLKKAKTVLETLKEEYDRTQNAVSRKAASASDLNRALLDLQRYEDTIIQLESQVASMPHQLVAAQQRLLSTQSEQAQADDELSRTEVQPPFSGVLSEVMVEQGQYVRAGEPLLRLTSTDLVEIPVAMGLDDFLQLDELLSTGRKPAASLAENETAKARWAGFVVRAAPEANADSRTVQIFVEVTNTDQTVPLLPGAFVHVRIDGATHQQKILIPREAIVDGHVYVVDSGDIIRHRSITLGRRLQSLVIVEKGINEGERVVVTNLDIVEDGRKVVVQSIRDAIDEVATLRSPEIRLLTSENQ